ncbi:MAG: hypothetical protein Q4C70_12075 [Planctomycetia bacterium]|nr:hypothetical protein [Planctomycetia bacterium]
MTDWRQVSETLLVLGVLGLGTFTGMNARAQYYSVADNSKISSNYAQNTLAVQNTLETADDITIGEMLAGQNSDSEVQESGYPVAVTPVAYREVPAVASTGVPIVVPTDKGNYATNANYTSEESRNVSGYPVATPVRMPSPRVQQTAYEEEVSTSAVSHGGRAVRNSVPTAVMPVAHVMATDTSKNVEPKTLPEDFPAGEIAPLNPNGLIAFSETATTPEGQVQQVTIIDPTQKVLCVYHINMVSGQIELKSARKIEWDLQLIFLNSKRPLPQDVQAILEQNPRRR